jgi:hypothetical protein
MKKDNGEDGMVPVHVKFSRELKEDDGFAWFKKHGYKDSSGQWQVKMDDENRDNHKDYD